MQNIQHGIPTEIIKEENSNRTERTGLSGGSCYTYIWDVDLDSLKYLAQGLVDRNIEFILIP